MDDSAPNTSPLERTSGEQLLRIRDVMERTKLGRSTIYMKMAAGRFPRPYDSGAGVRWKASEIDAWMASLKRRGSAN